jgi:pantoate--beta-alanine ligase
LVSRDELAAARARWRAANARVALVPTMGALHEGHLSLVRAARPLADKVVVSIFVNPTQFGPNEDFSRYPRTLKADLDLLAPESVEAVFLPNTATMYPDGFQTYVHNKDMALGLCGATRKGHFEGVLTVVLKLLNLVRPHVAVFGKKDYQQWRVIERMARDIDLDVEIVGRDTLRESDGLAMSSRNRYLSPEERPQAARIYEGLRAAQAVLAGGDKSRDAALAAFRAVIAKAPGLQVEYAELRARESLAPVGETVEGPVVLATALRLGATRLIDNLEMG